MEVIASLPKTALVTDDKFGPYELAQALANSGNKRIYIGECLSTAAEQIRSFAASEVPDEDYKMNVVVIVDEG